MPTAAPFATLGAGNGFSFCPNKVDVSGYDYWVTLGGYEKPDPSDPNAADPTQAEINLSLKNAMQLFWNLDGWTGRLYFNDSSSSYEITSLSMKNDNWTVGNDEYYANKLDGTRVDEPDFDPKDRVCYKSFFATKYASYPYSEISLGGTFVRMYNGATSNEDNFVGYGFDQIIIASLYFNYYSVEFSSYQNGTPASPTQTNEDISYVEIPTNTAISAIPAVGYIQYTYQGTGNIPDDFDTYSWELLQFEQSSPYDFAFKIDSLDFYTY